MYKKIIVLLFVSSLCQAASFKEFFNGMNSFLGEVGLHMKNQNTQFTIEPLQEDQEKLVRSILDKTGVDGVVIHKLHQTDLATGTHTLYNHLFVDETLLNRFSNQPDVVRFLIGHESAHIEKYHSIKRVALQFVPCFITHARKPHGLLSLGMNGIL